MTYETTIKRIQELVPDVMKLEFGCEFLRNKKVYRYVNACGQNKYRALSEDNMFDESLNIFIEEILGKPITLAVVLEAIREANVGFVFVTHSGTLHKKIGIEDTAHTYLGIWNLSKDNFNDQSDETKAFIGGLLN